MARLPLTELSLLVIIFTVFSTAFDGTHVRLVQPAARISERSFNASRNAEAPCPTVRQQNDAKNIIKAGKALEFVWFNPSAVQGSYRIELLNANYELISTIKDSKKSGNFETNGLTTDKINIPDTECKDCIIRLVQSTMDNSAQLLSCADVNILNESPVIVNKCEGEECTVECSRDEQCGSGTCVNGSCYCLEGFFGSSCRKESKYVPRQLDLEEYTQHPSSPDSKNKLYWKIEKNEIEVVLKFPTNTWTVFGFRPVNANEKCPWLNDGKSLRSDEQDGNSLDGFNKLPIRRIIDNKKVDAHGCGENEVFSNCPEYSRECEASCQWTEFPESIPSCPRACGKARCVCQEGFVRAGNDKNECVPFNVCQEEVAVECPQNQTWAKCGVACEPSCSTMYETAPCKQNCQQPACTCADNFVRINGDCIHWSNCPSLEQRVLKPIDESEESTPAATTVTHAPPTAPVTWTSSSSSASGEHVTVGETIKCPPNETVNECGRICEADCTTIFVRDECNECGKSECACIQGYARNNGECLYWGDCPMDGSGLQTVAPKSTIKQLLAETRPTTTTTTPFTPTTKIASAEKRTSAEARTTFAAASMDEDVTKVESSGPPSEVVGDLCFGEWRWPRDCRSNCDYRVSWNFAEASDEIEFSLETKMSSNWWTGIGFSKSGTMKDADLIVVKSFGGVLSLHDMSSTSYSTPKEDPIKNVYTPTVVGTHVNGVLRAQFTRKRNTGDINTDAIFTDNDCFHFLFPVSGGRVNAQGDILKHINTPHVTSEKVCIKSCQVDASGEKEDEPTCTNEFKFPENCKGDACDYIARWNFNESRDEVRFEVKSRGVGRWTGLGISKDGLMANSDIYTGWVYNGKAYVVDRFAYGRQLPAIDPADRQDLYDIGGKIEDDYQTLWFSRKIVPNDKTTDYRLDECYYFLFPIGGGRVLARKSQDFMNPKTPIGYHDLNNPKVSKTKVCICDDSGVPVKAVPSRVRARRQAVRNPFEDRDEPAFAGLPDMARIGQISIAELTGKAKYYVKMDPFACSDVTVLKVLNDGKSRVVDAFAQSKYGLEPDEFFGGEQSFTDISASEDNGEAIVLFKRSLKGSDVADHNIMPGNTQFFWANGPEGNLPVRISGAAHIETGFIDFFKTSKPVIADLGDEELPTTVYIPPPPTAAPRATTTTSSTTRAPTTTTTEEKIVQQTFKNIEATRATTTLETTEATTEIIETTTELPFIPVEVTEAPFIPAAATTTTDLPKTRPPTTQSNLIDEPDSGERETVVEPVVLSGETSESHPAAEIAPCHGSFVYPPKCNENCVYAVNWQTDGANAHFSLWAKLKTKMWSGIGFSHEGVMANADAIIVSVLEDSSVTVMDQWSPGYGRPTIDESQDIFGVSTRYVNGQLMANFSRSLATTDAGNDLDLTECQFFLFLQSGGHLEGGTNEIRKHFETPISSSSRICLGKCGAKEEIPTTSVPLEGDIVTKKQHKSDQNTVKLAGAPSVVIPSLKPPTHFVYDAVLKFKDLPFKDEFNDIESPQAEKMAVSIRNQLGPKLKEKWPQLQRIGIIKFAGPPVKALTRMEFEGANSPTLKEVETYLKQIAVAGKVGDLQIDSNDIMLAEQKPKVQSDEQKEYQDVIKWILVIIVILIILTCVVCCCCWSVCRKSKRKTYPAKQMSFAPPVMQQSFAGPYISEPIYDAKQQDRTLKRPTTSGSSPELSPQPKSHPEETPKGMGEVTYQEWYKSVASKDVPTHHQESTLSAAVSRPHSRMSGVGSVSGTPYISYPHESGFYTLGGEHRLPPPSYYRQY